MKQVNYKINVTTGNSDKNIKKTEKNVKGLGKDVKDVNKSSGNLNDSFAVMPGSIGRVVQSFKALKIAMLSSGIGAVVVGVGALAGLFAAATVKGAEFAKQMSTLKAISGATDEEMKALGKSAKDLGSTTQFTAVQVGELQTEFAKLGFTTNQILDATKATLDLAASMEVDLASAAMLAGSTVSAFGLEASETQRVVDVLALSTSSSALDFSTLTESLKNVAPAAKGLGISVEKTTALLGVMANAGKKGSLAGSQLRAALLKLAKSGKTVDEALTLINQQGDSVASTLKAIELGGEGGGQALAILASKEPEIAKLTETLNEAEGAATAMAEVRLDNLAGDTTKLESAWEGLLLSIEDGDGVFNQAARILVQYWTTILNAITTANAYIGAFFAEINESLSFIHMLKLGINATIDSIKITFLGLKKVIADIPFIGKGIDKKEIERSQLEIVKSIAKTTREAAYWADVADKRRESGRTFFERIQDRIAASSAKHEEQLSQIQEEGLETRDEASEEATEKELERLKKLAEERRKLEQKRLREEEKIADFLQRQKNTAFENELLTLMQQYDKRFELARDNAELEKQLTEQQALDIQAIKDKHAKEEEEKQKKIDGKKIDDEGTVLQKKLQMTSDALGAISELVSAFAGADEAEQRKAFKINKALSIAQALVNTSLAVTAALTAGGNPIKLATGAQFVEAGIAAALGAAQVAAIAKTRFESSGSGSSSSSIGSTGVTSQAPDFNVVGQSGFNQVAAALGENNNTPIKAFVVSGDVTSAQALENNIIDTATF